MKKNRSSLFTIISLFLAAIACVPIVFFIIKDPQSVSTWVSLMVGIGLSIPLYVYIGISIKKRKSTHQMPQDTDTNGSAYRWLIPTVIVGLLLGNIIWFFLGDTGREAVFIILSGWMVSTFCFFAFLIWRYSP